MAGTETGAGGLPTWVEEEPEPERRRSRPVVLVVLAVVPWLVVAATLLRDGRPAPDPAATDLLIAPTTAPDPVSLPTHADTDGELSPAARPTGTPAPWTVVASGARTATTVQDAAAIALVAARAFAHGDGAPLDAPGVTPAPLDGYVEHLVVEAVDHPAHGHAVVTLLAVVLRAADGRYVTAEVRRLAVPVQVDGDGARPAGAPWWLPPPDLGVVEVATAGVADEDLLVAAGEALQAAGYEDVATLTLAASGGWPIVATTTARAPGEDAPREHRLWLRRGSHGLVVAGSPPTAAAPSDTAPALAPVPSEEAAP